MICGSVHCDVHHCVLRLRSLWCSPLCSVAPFTVVFTTVLCGSVHCDVHHCSLWLRSLWCSPLSSVAPFTVVLTTVLCGSVHCGVHHGVVRRKRIILYSSSPTMDFKISRRTVLSMVLNAEDIIIACDRGKPFRCPFHILCAPVWPKSALTWW